MVEIGKFNKDFQADKSTLACLSLSQKPRQRAFAAEARR